MDYARKFGNQKTSSPYLKNKYKISTNYKQSTTLTEPRLIEDKKLSNWKKWLKIRKKDEENYKKRLNRNELLLNSGDNYRSILETRELIELAKDPLINYAYQTKQDFDLNFFITPEILSNHGNNHLPTIIVPNSRKLKLNNFSSIATPDLILREKGLTKRDEFKKRKRRINIIKKVPVITITNDNETENETSELYINPDAMIAALRIENENIGKRLNSIIELENNHFHCWDIKFNCRINEKGEKFIVFENKGNIKITYYWREIFLDSTNLPLLLLERRKKSSSFFFNKNHGIILPGQILNFPIWFKSGESGIKRENWRFVTDPLLSSENIIFRFWGFTREDEENGSKNKVQQIENYLNNKLRDSAIKEILDEIVNDALIFQPPEPFYKQLFLESDIFTTKNPSYFYNSILINEFREIYNKIFNNSNWNLSIHDLRNILLEIEDSEFQHDNNLSHFVNLCKAASEPISIYLRTENSEKYEKIYNLLCSFVNKFENEENKRKRDQMALEQSKEETWKTKKLVISKSRDIILYEEIFYLRIYEILQETISKACAIIDSFIRLHESEN
ncbi:MYCBP-associated protein-like [Leptopilina heterotoma]|uniref:MYCBP-associated protein-like n=1 Tax=Leptopilina heterotoma TaxID=63436 RepID=UPI001CA9C878|nr:MYCBP-associated protein-like [Leptopilina heterotoma]